MVPAPDTAQLPHILATYFDPKIDNFFVDWRLLTPVKHQYVNPDDWTVDELPPSGLPIGLLHDRGAIVGAGGDLGKLQRELAGENQTALAASLTAAAQSQGVALPGRKQPAPTDHDTTDHQPASSTSPRTSTFQPRTGLTTWSIGDIPESIQTTIATGSGHQEVTGYPRYRPVPLTNLPQTWS